MLSSFSFTAPVAPCEYLPDRLSQLRYEVDPRLRASDYMDRLREGWRRVGPAIFRPACPSCRMCRSLRVPVATFSPTASQRRAWKKNDPLITVRIGTPRISPERVDLFTRFHQDGRARKGWPEGGDDLRMFLANPFPTEEWTYYLRERMVAVGYVDALPEGLSAIYFYYDPEERHRSLGTFNVLSMINSAKERGLPHVYLGYYVEGCRSLEYKGRFRPNEVPRPGGGWNGFVP
jgi:arginine-tRNA-protein transferase